VASERRVNPKIARHMPDYAYPLLARAFDQRPGGLRGQIAVYFDEVVSQALFLQHLFRNFFGRTESLSAGQHLVGHLNKRPRGVELWPQYGSTG